MTNKLSKGTTRTGVNFWLRQGFLKREAQSFKDISYASIDANLHLKKMISNRKWQRTYYKHYLGYSDSKFRNHILEKYTDNGWLNQDNTIDAFRLIDSYRQRYGKVPTKGRVRGSKDVGGINVKTKGTSTNVSEVSNKSNRQQIANLERDITDYQWKLKFEKNPMLINSLKERIARVQGRIKELRG
jgi:hypothetical protein